MGILVNRVRRKNNCPVRYDPNIDIIEKSQKKKIIAQSDMT